MALVINLIFSVIPRLIPAATAIAILVGSILWHLRGQGRFPGDKMGIQAVRTRALYGRYGRLYFGVLLGLGVLTAMTTPAVYGLLFAEAGLPRLAAISLGIGFGGGRSLPAMAGLVMGGRGGPASAASWITRRTIIDRIVGVVAAAVLVAVLVVAA